MDFDQLITFLEVARQGSFSRAGEKVFRSQSAVSAQIRQLEQEYGDRLLDRSGKTVKLTPAGQIFYEYAERLKNLRDESLTAVADHSSTPRGTLRVGANEATCLYVLPEVFGKYCRRYPPVRISIYRNFSYKIVEKLENGAIEVGVLTLPIQSPSLKIQPIFRDAQKKIGPAQFRLKGEGLLKARNRFFVLPLLFTDQAQIKVRLGKARRSRGHRGKTLRGFLQLPRTHGLRCLPESFAHRHRLSGGRLRNAQTHQQPKHPSHSHFQILNPDRVKEKFVCANLRRHRHGKRLLAPCGEPHRRWPGFLRA